MIKKVFTAPIKVYQSISRLMPGKCRYYPTCSEYALWQFDTQNPMKAFYKSTLRILRCNQFFSGGIDYPVIGFKPEKISIFKSTLNSNYGTISVKYWLLPKDTKQYYVVKDFNDCRVK